ncbi:myb/SANT-like domain-containing protein [Artemisia annua]|uniref:Myb/SANT-like domain-containing protein n=1 Tax=Artemisia annua TaxID=35608 RepID=A0A2U1LKU4_ARTAN|nr:myb/SANT-like domain-containing protein [Artemisia annua]
MDDDLHVMAKKHLLAAVYGASLVVVFIAYRRLHNRNRNNAPTRDMMLHRQQVREEMMHNLITSGKCRQLIRMSENAFKTLCQKLQRDASLRPTQRLPHRSTLITFTPHVYANMVEELSLYKPDIKKENLQNRLKTLKGNFAQYYDIFRGTSLSGFSWNPVTKLMDAEEEVWEALIKNKPEASKWRKKPMNHYDELFELFAKDRANGDAAETAKERNNRMKTNEQRVETIDEIDQLLETNEIVLEQINHGDSRVTSQVKPTNVNTSKNKKRKLEEDADFTSKIMISFNNLADAIKESNKVMANSRPHVYSEGEIYNELELLGLEQDDIPPAYLFLVNRPDKMRALMGCPRDMRVNVLAIMMDTTE